MDWKCWSRQALGRGRKPLFWVILLQMNETVTLACLAGLDATPMVRAAVERCLRVKASKLLFEPGRYDFWPDRAAERYLFPSNNDEGLKRIAFPLFECQGLEVDGQGSRFVFHGRVMPFALIEAAGVTLRNFSIDWQRPFHSEGRVAASRDDGVDLDFSEEFPYRVEHGQLTFEGEGGEVLDFQNILEFDPRKRETAFLAFDNYGIGRRCQAQEISARRVRLTAEFTEPRPIPGNVLALMHRDRLTPAIFVQNSARITLEDVTIHHAGGMGVIAQRSRDLRLRRVRVTPPPGGKRIISTTADATHFVNCRGRVELIDCLFENQMDDPTNVHGIYARVTGRPSDNAVEVRLMHVQQLGVKFLGVGDRLEFLHGDTLITFHEAEVRKVTWLNKEYIVLTFDEPLPKDLGKGDVVGNLTWSADLTIRDCVARGNRARGFLVSTPGRVLIENNRIHSPGAAILLEGDANHWYEAGPVRDVLIRGNRFEDCNFGVWGRAAVQITPGIPQVTVDSVAFHRNVRIEGNTFVAFDKRIVYARCVDGLTIRDNTIEESQAYEPQHANAEPFDTAGCRNVTVIGNRFIASEGAEDRGKGGAPGKAP